jgi:Tfp pilus assembly pilus retraction ATPase PilT
LKTKRDLIPISLLCPVLLLLMLPGVVQAQFNFTTNNGAITIIGYTGSGGAVTIPDTINGLGCCV